ncbi:MAG: hypothetical protein ABFS42_13380 [Candidatus Krumholzibacteriota bacterium]
MSQKISVLVILMVLLTALAGPAFAAEPTEESPGEPVCRLKDAVGVIAAGEDPKITFKQYAALCAPILWLSPDEPNLLGASGKDIMVPMAFPFEGVAESPVVYYRIRTLLVRADQDDEVIIAEDADRVDTLVDFRQIAGVDLDFFFYYPSEEGLGAHEHDVEAVYLKTFIQRCEHCEKPHYALRVDRTIAKAHGILWYDNTLLTDQYTEFPMTILVEEGKHASCPDKNQDGVYTPTYDVNTRVNDAWGLRDIMRSGGLYSGGWQAWMAKKRTPEYRVFPPSFEGFALHEKYLVDGVYAPDNAIYELRPFPRSDLAEAYDPHLTHFIADKGDEDWPEIVENTDLTKFGRWLDEDRFINSYSLSLRLEGLNYGSRKNTVGLSMIFPLLIVKNVADPVGGGWFVNRVYLKDQKFRDLSWNLMYTTSASRWFDGYFAMGWEWDKDDEGNLHTDQMTEAGLKMRFNMNATPLRFLTVLGTDFWGVRFGMKNKGFLNWESIGYAIEVGAGSF